ncbi:hypothetical protein PSH87_07320 [Pseudomonas sp. FP453]|uniref:hypothetical protein n=1 Tax=Pseudomonas sp. FP453 TaxID=2954094 RepID=UPI00273632F0|nr:hypothetical protein [Pseudomonas sp. FP453]WLH91795.1 hypothetical protein PSH87_07320 [Pseudomonas sp. FP453]
MSKHLTLHRLEVLAEHAFWQSSDHNGQLRLTKGFAFVSGNEDVTVATCPDIFLTILWILQNARQNAKIKDAKRLESGELQQVLLTPEVFSRYDDGIIQGAFAQPYRLSSITALTKPTVHQWQISFCGLFKVMGLSAVKQLWSLSPPLRLERSVSAKKPMKNCEPISN